LPEELSGKFDAVLCLGNSLTYLFDREDREKTVGNFARLVRPGGVVIIDQRNYDYMLDERGYILRDPVNNFRYSGKFCFCNPRFRAFPVEIEDDRVVLNYSKDGNDLSPKLEFYPIRRKELTSLMRNAGLSVRVYGDFEEGKTDGVDFFQQVGVKGG